MLYRIVFFKTIENYHIELHAKYNESYDILNAYTYNILYDYIFILYNLGIFRSEKCVRIRELINIITNAFISAAVPIIRFT